MCHFKMLDLIIMYILERWIKQNVIFKLFESK